MNIQLTSRQKVLIYAIATVLFWGSSFPVSKIAQVQFTPASLGFLRCSIASILLLLLGGAMKMQKPRKKDMGLFVGAGLTGFTIYLVLFNTGLLTVTAATSSVIIALTPIFTAIGASKVYHEKISVRGWSCIFSAFIGVLILLLWNGIFSIRIGALYLLGAALMFCVFQLLNRELIHRGYSSLEVTTYSMLVGAIGLGFALPEGISQIMSANPEHLGALLFLSIFPSALSYFLWGKALSYAENTSQVTNFIFCNPLISTTVGFLLLGEIPSIETFIGGIIIIGSILQFNRQNS